MRKDYASQKMDKKSVLFYVVGVGVAAALWATHICFFIL